MAHCSTFPVRFNELDPYGHVNHSVYVTYFEIGRTEALTACGAPLEKLAKDGYQMVVTRIEVDFRAAAEAGDTIVVETEIGELKRASGVWRQRIFRLLPEADGADQDRQLLVAGTVSAGVTDRRGRPTRPPQWLFPALETLLPDQGSMSQR